MSNIRFSRCNYPLTKPFSHSRVTFFGGKSSDVDACLCFHLKVRASHLQTPPYSEYQQFLYDTIVRLFNEAYNYKQIADWMDENGYQTPTGKNLETLTLYSIVRKKKKRDVKINKIYEPTVSNFLLKFIDRTLVNQVDMFVSTRQK